VQQLVENTIIFWKREGNFKRRLFRHFISLYLSVRPSVRPYFQPISCLREIIRIPLQKVMANFHTFKIIQSFIFLIGENKKLVHWTVALVCLLWLVLLPRLPWSLKLTVIFWLPILPRFFASHFYLKFCYAHLLSSSIFMSPSLPRPTPLQQNKLRSKIQS
jgi:hypothetical protein